MLTKAQWLQKLKRLVPKWVFQENVENEAVFSGLAAVLEATDSDSEQHLAETFIDQATEEYVELHGDERSVERLPSESLGSYRARVKQIVNNSNIPAIKSIVDSLLIKGECTIIEHSDKSGNFLNRESFLNRNIIDFTVLYNAFTIIIEFQIPDPNAFYNRESFLNREFLTGSNMSSETVFENIINAVNKNKAYGTVYRLIERAN